MPKGKLECGDVNELAQIIRQAIGATTYEDVDVVTPEFDRTDGRKVVCRPRTAEQLDRIKTLDDNMLREVGMQVWENGKGWKHWLFPAEWYDCIPDGYIIVDINCAVERFKKGATDDDRRGGALAYGFIKCDEELVERNEDSGEIIYLHSPDCPSFCDFACNGEGNKIADVVRAAEVGEERLAQV